MSRRTAEWPHHRLADATSRIALVVVGREILRRFKTTPSASGARHVLDPAPRPPCSAFELKGSSRQTRGQQRRSSGTFGFVKDPKVTYLERQSLLRTQYPSRRGDTARQALVCGSRGEVLQPDESNSRAICRNTRPTTIRSLRRPLRRRCPPARRRRRSSRYR